MLKKAKEKLRHELLTKRFEVSSTFGEENLFHNLIDNVDILKESVIAGYYQHANEIDVSNILSTFSSHHTICLPVIDHHSLKFHVWDPNKEMITNHFGIQEPNINYTEEVTPNIIIIPSVGLGLNGHRVGYGFGYYDRTILELREQNQEILTIGVGYDFQVVNEIPFNEKDVKLDWIITDKRAIQF